MAHERLGAGVIRPVEQSHTDQVPWIGHVKRPFDQRTVYFLQRVHRKAERRVKGGGASP